MGSSSVTGKSIGAEVGPCHTYCFHLIPVRSARQKRLEWQSSRLAPFGTKHELILTARERTPLSHPNKKETEEQQLLHTPGSPLPAPLALHSRHDSRPAPRSANSIDETINRCPFHVTRAGATLESYNVRTISPPGEASLLALLPAPVSGRCLSPPSPAASAPARGAEHGGNRPVTGALRGR